MNKITLLLFIWCLVPRVFGQVLNLDRENGEDTVFRRNIFSLNFGFSLELHSRKQMRHSMAGPSLKTMGICKCG